MPRSDVVNAEPGSVLRGALAAMEAYRIAEIAHDADLDTVVLRHKAGLRRRLSALASIYHGGSAFAFGWFRRAVHADVEVIAGGKQLVSNHGDDSASLLLPASSTAQRMDDGFMPVLRHFPHWTRICGINDGLLTSVGHPQASTTGHMPLEDGLLGTWHGSFGWLVVAEPVSAAAIENDMTLVSEEAISGRSRRDSPKYSGIAERAERRYRELQQALASGLWRIHVLAGAETATDASRVAGLLCSSWDLDGVPYALIPGRVVAALEDVLDSETADQHDLTSPIKGSSRLLAALAAPPVREIPGLRIVTRPDFDVVPQPTALPGDRQLELGVVLDRYGKQGAPASVPYDSLLRHTIVSGATGSGKSQTIRNLLEQATQHGLPWLVVEPAKAEYRLMANRLAGTSATVTVIRPGDANMLAAGINPLEPAWLNTSATGKPQRFALQTHADMVRALFLASFDAEEPFPQVLTAALTKCYEDAGWDLALGEPRIPGTAPRYPTLGDLTRAAEHVVGHIGYSEEITRNVTGYIKVRIQSLRHGTTGRFLEGGHRLDFAKLLQNNVIFEIEDVGDDRDKAFLMGTVLIRLVQHLRLRQQHHGPNSQPLRHLAVFEEAHRLLRHTPASGPAAHAVEMFASLLAEVRAYGQGIILAEQIPTKIAADAIKNTAIKVVHRLPARDDRDVIGATMNLTDAQSAHLVTLRPGQAALFTDGMDNALLVQMTNRTSTEHGEQAPVTSAAQILIPRSGSCSSDCHTSPCTLRQMRQAQQLLSTQTTIGIWAELAVLGHLTGWAMPVPRPALLGNLMQMSARVRDCALSHAVDGAIAARINAASTVDGEELASHIMSAMHGRLHGQTACTAEEPQFLARPYRWALVWDALRDSVRNNERPQRHPKSADWETVYDRPIPGANTREQLTHVQRWLDDDQRDKDLLHTLAFGDRQPSALQTMLGIAPANARWNTELDIRLSQFRSCTWPTRYLRVTPDPAGQTL